MSSLAAKPSHGSGESAPKVLLVEAEVSTATELKRCLETAGFSVLPIAKTASAALRTCAASRADLILADGIEIAVELRKFSDAPLLLLTEKVDRETLNRAASIAPV